jgi:excisionase family DNA binding protein
MGISRELVYDLIKTGQLRSVKAGARRLIVRHHIMAFLDGGEPGAAIQLGSHPGAPSGEAPG